MKPKLVLKIIGSEEGIRSLLGYLERKYELEAQSRLRPNNDITGGFLLFVDLGERT